LRRKGVWGKKSDGTEDNGMINLQYVSENLGTKTEIKYLTAMYLLNLHKNVCNMVGKM
jgi:hypothetical protein